MQAESDAGQSAVVGVVDQSQSRDTAGRHVLDRGLDGDPLLEPARFRGCERARPEQGGGEDEHADPTTQAPPLAKAPSNLRNYLAKRKQHMTNECAV